MENIFQIANGALEGIIWLIIIVFWGIAQLLNGIKKSQRNQDKPDGPPRETPRPDNSREPSSLPEFLEEIFEQRQARKSPPPPPARGPVLKPLPAQPAAGNAVASKKAEKMRELKRRRDAEQMDAFGGKSSESVSGMRSFKLPTVKLPTTGNPLSRSKLKRDPRIAFQLRRDENFKMAVLNRTILGPPKALEDDQFINRY